MNARLLPPFIAIGLCGCGPSATSPASGIVATFSVVARDRATGDLGVAVASKYFGVGSVVPWARAGVGAVATQALPNVSYGVDALDLLAGGMPPEEALTELTAADPGRDHRQLAIIDAAGRTAAHTGGECRDWAGHLEETDVSVQGNLLAGENVLPEMVTALKAARSVPGTELADWLLAALRAGEAAGGDIRGRQSAAILVVREGGLFGANDRYIDLRVEDHADPVAELTRLLALHKDFFGRQPAAVPTSGPQGR